MHTTFKYCLKNGLLGVGWRTNTNSCTTNWDKYFNEAKTMHKKLQVCKYIKKWVSQGDLVWTRDEKGQYFLSRVNSGWEYWVSQEAKDLDIDVANIFRCALLKVDIDAVPGKIVACFRSPKSIQKVNDIKAHEYSKYLWNTLSGDNIYQIDKSLFNDIFMMLDDEETEDLLFLYLQSQGWFVLPNSRKGDTMRFEYFAVNPTTGEKVFSQVKTGNTSLNIDDYSEYPFKIFLFQSNGIYAGTNAKNVTCVSREDLLAFLHNSLSWLPKSFQFKTALVCH